MSEQQVNEFQVAYTIRSRHGKLFKLVEEFGSIEALARAVGVSAGTLGTWVNLQARPGRVRKGGTHIYIKPTVHRAVAELCRLAKCSAEELFPGWLDKEKLNRLRIHEERQAYVSHNLLEHTNKTRLLTFQPEDNPSTNPELVFEEREQQRELKALLESQLRTLPVRYAQALKLRFLEQKTLAECGEALGVSMNRARELVEKSIRKLIVNDKLRQFFQEYYEPIKPLPLSSTGDSCPNLPETLPPPD